MPVPFADGAIDCARFSVRVYHPMIKTAAIVEIIMEKSVIAPAFSGDDSGKFDHAPSQASVPVIKFEIKMPNAV